jgi:hypothetical protein
MYELIKKIKHFELKANINRVHVHHLQRVSVLWYLSYVFKPILRSPGCIFPGIKKYFKNGHIQ